MLLAIYTAAITNKTKYKVTVKYKFIVVKTSFVIQEGALKLVKNSVPRLDSL